MKWGRATGARLRRMAPLAAAISLTTLAGISPLAAQDDLASIAGVEAAVVEQGMWGRVHRAQPKAGAVEVGAIARYTVMFKADSVVGHLSRQASPPRISSGRPGSVGRLDLRSPEAMSYVRAQQSNQLAAVAEFSQRVGRDLQPVHAMQHALNAVVLDLDPVEAAEIAGADYAQGVQLGIEGAKTGDPGFRLRGFRRV